MSRCHHHHQSYRHGGRQNTTAYIAVNTRLCKACWKCVTICPQGVITKIDFIFHRHVRISTPGDCIGCLACAKACPEGAIMALKRAQGSFKD